MCKKICHVFHARNQALYVRVKVPHVVNSSTKKEREKFFFQNIYNDSCRIHICHISGTLTLLKCVYYVQFGGGNLIHFKVLDWLINSLIKYSINEWIYGDQKAFLTQIFFLGNFSTYKSHYLLLLFHPFDEQSVPAQIWNFLLCVMTL